MKLPSDWQPRTVFLWLVTGLASLAFTVLVITFLNLNWESWLTDNGYERSYRLLGPAMSWLANVGASWPFAFVSGGLIVGALILWIHVALNRHAKLALTTVPMFSSGTTQEPMPLPAEPEAKDGELPSFSPEGFNYPYPKAVLQAAIPKPKGTQEAHPGKPAHRMTIVMQVTNAHHSTIREWLAYIYMAQKDGDDLGISGSLRMPRNLTIQKDGVANIPLISRDLSDTISKPPFLLRLADRQVPLKDGSKYTLFVELRSGNPHPTQVMIFITTGTGLDAEATISYQTV